MEIAKVRCSDTRCTLARVKEIPCGIVGATVSIEYIDPVWDSLQKTVVFRGTVTKDVLAAGNEVAIPAEVVSESGDSLYMGIYGVDATGTVIIPTVWVELGLIRDAATPSGDSSTSPYLPVWAQIQAMIGDLNELDTTAKESLVAAVNEALLSGGGTVSPAAVQKIVDDYLKANPPASGKDGSDGITPTIGSNGNWYIGSTDTGKPSRGAKGGDGEAGRTPVITAAKSGKVTTINVDGTAIATINDGADGVNGRDGIDGVTPVIGDNGNWYLGNTDTGKPSKGEKGDPGVDAAVDISLGLTAAVGQTIVVKAVDADGKPTQWEAVELLADPTLLPVATNVTLGGVKPVAKTDEMTQDVGVDSSGALFTVPSGIEDGSVTPDKTSFIRKAYHNILNWKDPDAQDGYFFYSDRSANTTGSGNAAFSVSGFIPVTAGVTYGFRSIRVVKWLDAQKAYLSTTATAGLGCAHVTAPENAAYMRIDVNDVNKEKAYIYEYITDDYAYSAYGTEYEIVPKDAKYTDMLTRAVNDTLQDTDISDYVRDNSLRWAQLNGISEFHWNIINPEKCRFGITIDGTTGEEKVYNNTSLYMLTSDYEAVVPGEVLYGGNNSVYCYDSDKQYLSKLTWNSGAFTIPENGRFVRVSASGYLTAQDSARIYLLRNQYGKTFRYSDSYSYDNAFPMFSSADCLNGFKGHLGIRRRCNQTIAVIGDSFTAPGTWVNIMCENLGAYKLKDYAVSGGSFCKLSGVPKTAYEQAQEMAADGKAPDIILVTLGTNDSNNGRDIGEINYSNDVSTFDLTTFSGGLQACLNYLANSFPSAKIYVGWTPMGGLYSTDHDPEPYIARMKSICMAYGITYIETRTCGVSPLVNAHAECFEAGTSGGHPTNAGQQRIAAYMTQVMECTP